MLPKGKGQRMTSATQPPTNAAFEALAHQLLEPCPKEAADKATTIRRQLKADLGRWQADAVLSLFKEVCLRHQGVCSRYFTNAARVTVKLRRRHLKHPPCCNT